MGKKPNQRNRDDSLLKFWAFWLTSFYCVVGLFGVVILEGAIRNDRGDPHILPCAIGGLFAGFACIAVAAFGGLLWRQVWARPLLLIVSWAALIGFPIGTGFGIMVLFELRNKRRYVHPGNENSSVIGPKNRSKGG